MSPVLGHFPQLIVDRLDHVRGVHDSAYLWRVGQERGESAFEHHNPPSSRQGGITQVAGDEPTPEFAAELIEEFNQRIAALDDPGLQEIAIQKLEGYSNAEIADQRGCTERTIERKLTLIRKIWAGQ